MPNLIGYGTALPSPYSPGLSHPGTQQSKRTVQAADGVASISLRPQYSRPQIRSDRDLRNDSDSTLVPIPESSNFDGSIWSSYDEDMELATVRPVINDKIGMGLRSPGTVKALPPPMHERCSQLGWL